MRKKRISIGFFLGELLRRRRTLPSRLAADLGISHATISRWLSGKDIPSIQSCVKLAEISGSSITDVLSAAGHIPVSNHIDPIDLPEFRDYARKKYPNVLDEDLVIMIEDLIERRRVKRRGSKNL